MQPQQTSLGAGRKVSLLAFQELSENLTENLQIATGNLQNSTEDLPPGPQTAYGNRSSSGSVNSRNSESLLTNVLSSLPVGGTMQPQTSALSDLVCAMASSERPNVPASTSLTSHQTSSSIIVMEITPPVIGMTFSCYEDAREFYDAYSMRVGFGTKVKSSSFDRKTNEKNLVLLTCCKQGYKNESNIVCYRRPNVRVGCNAHLKIKLNDDKQWKVISVELEHNHECSPSKSRRFRSHKHMESGSKRRLELNCNSGVSLPKSYRTFVREAGGYEHVPFDQRDAQNHIDKYRRLQLKEGDAESMHKYFRKMQTKCSDFFYMIDLDEEGRLKNVFWADERSRAAYSYFGDVVTFDTTYLTNWYDLKFAPFVGVNHHGQSVLFGCGLLANETVESFIWLFKAWLTSMPRCPPDAIITDQCKAIEMAIIDVFPNARHRLCLWHIMKKISEKLGSLSEYKAIKKAMKNAVYDSLRINEFEMVWASFINRYRLQDNAWLTTLYSLRRQWVPVFLKDNFFAGMSTTQRSESMNAFFDGYVHSKTSLKEFVDQYEFALEEKYEKESKADFDSFNSFPSMKTSYYFERQIASVYTRGMFQNFQDELHGIGLCSKSEVKVEGQIITYAIKERTFDKKGNLSTPVIYEVFFNKDEVDVFCICRLFQYKGILCKHALCVLNEFVDEIPSQYILRRWRKDFKRKYVENRLPVNVDLKNPVQRYDVLHPYALQILEEGALSETKYKIVMDGLLDLKRKVLNADGGHEASDIEESQTPFNNGAESMQSEHVKLKNPLQATKIGRPKGRLISSSEKNVKSKITKLLNQMATKRSVGDLKEADLKGKKVFVRVDLNVPLDDNLNITDDTRVRAAIPTIKYLMGNGAKVILCSHLGRPKGVTPKYSLKPLEPRLSELLGVKVEMANDCIGEEVEKLVAALPEGGVLLLENVRFYKEEEKNDPEFAKKLACLADLYVNDAFGTAHRAHASTEGVTKYLKPAVAGFLMQKELDYLVGAVSNPKKPFAAIVGGSKVSSKIGVIESLLEKVDILLLGGGMIFTFYKAQGKAVGSSLVEEDKLTLATTLMEKAKAKGVSLLLPTDVVIADKFAPDANSEIVAASSIPDGWMGLDIGPDSIKTFGVALDTTQTVIWNGPMGVFEFDKFAAGTTAIAKKLADLSGKGVTTIIGGGDSVAAVEKAGLADKMSHISTGGGASLELLEGKPLPGVLALDEA